MKFMKKLSLFIMFLVIGTFFSKNSYSKEKSSNSYYEYTTEKIKIYSDENKNDFFRFVAGFCCTKQGAKQCLRF